MIRPDPSACWSRTAYRALVLGLALGAALGSFSASTASAQASQYALRFYGLGTNQDDRVRIQIDDDGPGPDASTPVDIGAGDFTIEFWARGLLADNATTGNGGDVERFDYSWINGNIVLDRDVWQGTERSYGISFAGGLIQFGTGSGDPPDFDPANTIEGSQMVLDGNWHHIAVTREQATGIKRIYVDGLQDFASSPGVSTADLSFPDAGAPGQLTPWGQYIVLAAEKHDAGPSFPSFDGFLDEFRVWNVLRSPAEILAERDRIVSADSPGLVGYYRFEEGSNTTLQDMSAAGSPAGELLDGVPGNGEWVAYANDPLNTAPISSPQPPVVVAGANPTQGNEPLSVMFSSLGSSDPEPGPEPLSYSWVFGDGATSEEANPTHLYSARGAYSASLTVSDGIDLVSSDPILILVGNPPTPAVITPGAATLYGAGDAIAFSGSASDLEDGGLPASALNWSLLSLNGAQLSTVIDTRNGVPKGSFLIPTSGYDPRGSHFEIELSATDSDGLPGSTRIVLDPRPSVLSFDSRPSGIELSVDSEDLTTPFSFVSLAGFEHDLRAPLRFELEGVLQRFLKWSQGGALRQTLVAPPGGRTLTAIFYRSGRTLSVAVPARVRNAEFYPPQGQGYTDFYDPQGLCCGRDGNGEFQVGLEFPLAVPRGVRIDSAVLEVLATADQSGNPEAVLWAYDVADAPAFDESSNQPLTAWAPLTRSSVSWTFPTFANGQTYASPDLGELVQEVVRRADWLPGNHIGIVIDGSSTSGSAWRCFRNYDSGSPALLRVTYSALRTLEPVPR